MNLTRERAVNQAIVIGKFPRLHAEKFVTDAINLTKAQREAIATIAPLIHNRRTVMIRGSYGTGKTHMATAIGVTWYEKRYSLTRGKARYWTMAGLLADEKSWFGNKLGRDEPIKIATECGLLVIDELLTTHESVFDQTTTRELIDARYRNKLATVLMTNLDNKGIANALDAPTIDRMFDGGYIVELTGESQRKAVQ